MKAEVIRKWGYDADLTTTVEEALSRLSRNFYDMMIRDIDYPGGKGYDLIPRIKKFNRDIYIVAMTAYNSRDLERKVRRQGVVYYMVKPFGMDEVKDLLDHSYTKKCEEVS